MKIPSIILLLLITSSANADNCDKPKNDFDDLYCMNKIFLQADKDLNKSYKKLRKHLKKKGKRKLKYSQRAWISDRNETCSLKKGIFFYVSIDCTAIMTIERTTFLANRIRECKATGCQLSKLSY